MKIHLTENQILHWPKYSDYNLRWNFEVKYDLIFHDKKSYNFKSNFIFHTKEKKIYYKTISDYIQFKDIDWDFKKKINDKGEFVGFGSTKNFIFYCTKYIGDFEIEEDKRGNVFSAGFNPFNFSTEDSDNQMNFNRNKVRDWWLENENKIIEEIISKKEIYNSLLSDSFNNTVI